LNKKSARDSGAQTAAAVFFDRVAERILAQHAPPDLRSCVVILPNYHVVQPLAQALVRAAQLPALLLPEMVTLNDWARRIRLEQAVMPESRRTAMLYQALQARRWFGQADLWSMAQELLKLFDELTYALEELPPDAEAFAAVVQRAYEAKQNGALQLEARLVFELWHAMQDGEEPDGASAYQRQLALLTQQADRSLFVLRTSDWETVEQHFLDEYASLAPVEVFDVRDMGAPDRAPLFFAATSLEQEARAAAMQVRLWLKEGKRNIAVVAQDRVVARRMRALLERAKVLVADETGWTYATLSVSTVLDRWLTALQSDFYHHDLLDLLKSPFIFADMAAAERKAAVYQLEQLLRENGVVSGLEAFVALVEHDSVLAKPLQRLRDAATLMERDRSKSLVEWLQALHKSLGVLGIDVGLLRDEAGAQLLQAFDTWQQELAGDEGGYRYAEWRRWLAQQLDIQTYRDTGIDSPVRFTHLAATRLRSFDAVLLLGCDADHLPGAVDGGRWFNDAVRAALQLPTRTIRAARLHDDLRALLALNDCVLVTWQRERNGEQGLLSPYLQILRDEHEQASGGDLSEKRLDAYLAEEDRHRVELTRAAQPVPGVPREMVPGAISISAYNSLVACPYQYYARHILKLNELDEVQEVIEKRDYGEHVHAILQCFHERYPKVSGHAADEMETALQQISEEVFADLLARDFVARAWLARWCKSLPSYLDWQFQSEEQGWRYAEAETAFERELDGVRLRGRVDRIDLKDDERRVIDYKTQGDQLLRNKLKEAGEDVQLACYAYAEKANEVAFLSIEGGKVKTVEPQHELSELAQANVERLQQLIQQVQAGAGFPANGIDRVCGWCEMRGVCRKGEWLDG
jgi:ATP-dependent helicase/nuclease subunit B